MENLVKGKSLIIIAPTGLGKTELALVPFIYGLNDFLSSQIIYSLPTESLVESSKKLATKREFIEKCEGYDF